MKTHIKKYGHWYLIAGVMLCSAMLVFKVNGLYDTRVDGTAYIGQVSSFATGNIYSSDPSVMIRLFKPFYAIIGGTLLHTAHPAGVILVLNLLMYALLALSALIILRELDFDVNESAVGVLWIVTAYPLLKYGLSLGTDISGWFFSAATLAIGLVALRKDSVFLICVASIIGFLGSTSKESGVLGLIALFLLIFWRYRKKGMKKLASYITAAALPALTLYLVLTAALIGHAPTFLDWYSSNTHTYFKEYYSLAKWIAVEASTFNILWLLSITGFVAMIRMRKSFKQIDVFVCMFIATLPVLLWPLFISRILLIQFLWVVPLALIGLRSTRARIVSWPQRRQELATVLIALVPIVCNLGLFLISGGGSLFTHV